MGRQATARLVNPPPDRQQEPLFLADFKKGILVPRPAFEAWMERFDWTYHQLARHEYPPPFSSLDEFQLACVCDDPCLWCRFFLREPEDTDHQEPYNFWDYQIESLRYDGSTIHKCGAEVGKTREIVPKCLYLAFTRPNGSGLVGAPQQTHLEEIIEAMYDQLQWNPDLGKDLLRWKKHPHHAFYFKNHFKIDFRPSGYDGEAYRGVHVRTFAIKDEAAKDKNKKQWSEFWRAMKPGCVAKIYSVPDGDRSCEFFRLAERAKRSPIPSPQASSPLVSASPASSAPSDDPSDAPPAPDSFKDVSSYVKNLTFRLFQWPKTIMPFPYWSEERRRFYVEQYGGEDAPEYKHNVLGEDGDPENTVFPWHQLKHCIRDIPEYRALKVLVDSARNEVIITGYRCEYVLGQDGPIPQIAYLIDRAFTKGRFFALDESGESEFRRLIKSFFVSVSGLKRGGADLGFAGDPSELGVKLIIGHRERLVARLQMKHVTYDQQCQALDALDDIYGPLTSLKWGTDFGNAGSAVAHDLQGLPQYAHKQYEQRLTGFMFESTTGNIDEEGNPVIDAKTEEPAKIYLKELATDILVKKMQKQELEYPADPDIVLYYTNHTVRSGGKHRIFKKEDDHLIDMDRTQILSKLLGETMEDLFACGN